ncbi:MAG: amidohydrolase family protein [Promethearchaeota archaeon]
MVDEDETNAQQGGPGRLAEALGGVAPVDAHAHVFPPRLFEAIWDYFDRHYWRVKYRLNASQVADFYDAAGFAGFTTFNYAHKPGISAKMNQFTHDFCRKHPSAIPFGTVHPGDPDPAGVAEEALSSYGFVGLKFQLLVTDFPAHDPRLFPVYDVVRREDAVLAFHAGTGPLPNRHVGVRHFRKFLERYPDLRVQVAHLGCYEYSEFFALLDKYHDLYLDSAMILVDHDLFPSGFDLGIEALLDHQDRLLFGSDFPNLPYSFEESYRHVLSLGLPQGFLRRFFRLNADAFYRRS